MEKQTVNIKIDEFLIREPRKQPEKTEENKAQASGASAANRPQLRPIQWAKRQGSRIKKANVLERFWSKGGSDDVLDAKKTMALVMKFVAAAAICLAVFLLTLSGSPTAQKITQGLNNAINYTVDIDETLGKLKLVDANTDNTETSAKGWNMQMPILATIQSSFGETGEGVVLKGAKDSLVGAAASGYVFAVGKDDELGNFVKVRHSESIETVYYGLNEIVVEENAVVDRGSELGTTDEGTLRFEVHVNGVPVDPLDYINLA
ncbi:MAG: peptidoglycan DD-metalloendopeptidase family protein [Christensenellales bacterium]